MSNRSVVVTLKAEVAGFKAAMDSAGASSRKADDDLARFSANGNTNLGRLTTSATQHKEAWTTAGVALLGFGAAAAAGVGMAIKSYADFSSQMAQVQSLSHANTSDMDALTQAALTMGQSIGFSASQVADGEIEMVKAGISVKDILGGALPGALTLAAAGQISVADATEIATVAMTQFGLSGKDVPHVADLLAAGADKALGGVSDLGEALKSGGLVAHQFGMSLDDTVGTLALFAQNGLMGEAAGTDLRQMLLKLAAPSKTATDDMTNLGMSLYDSQGHFVGITNLAGQLHDKMQNLSEAERNAMMAHIFGARSIVGANILYQAGAAGVQQWIDTVNDSGFAAKQAAGKMDSLNGDMQKLQAAWETGMIQMGSTAQGFVRPIVQGLTDVVRGFDQLPEPVKGMILGFGGVVGAAALAGGAFLTLTPKVLDVYNGFKKLSEDGSKVPGMLGKIGLAAAGVTAALAAMSAIDTVNSKGGAAPSMEQTADAVLKLNQAAGQASNLDGLFKNWDSGLLKKAPSDVNDLASAVTRLTHVDGIDGFNTAITGIFTLGQGQTGLEQVQSRMKSLGETLGTLATGGNLQAAAAGFNKLSIEYQKNGKTAQDALDAVPGYRDALIGLAHDSKQTLNAQDLLLYATGAIPASMMAAGQAAGNYVTTTGQVAVLSKDQADAIAQIGLAADGTITDLDKLVTSMEQAGLIQISANQAASNYYAALDAVDAAIKQNGTSLDIHTEKGRANQKALDDVASAGLAVVQANAKNGASQEELSANLHGTYNDLLANYAAFGITGDKADTMARQVLGIPKGVSIDTAIQNYADSMLKLEGIGKTADAISGHRAIVIDVSLNADGAIANYDNLVQQTRSGKPIADSTGGVVPARAYATGGNVNYLAGGGTPIGFAMVPQGTDTVPAMLTPDEFVVNRKQSIANRPVLEAINNGAVYRPAPVYTPAGGSRGGGGSVRVSAPDVKVYIGNEQLDSRMVTIAYRQANQAITDADNDAQYRRLGN